MSLCKHYSILGQAPSIYSQRSLRLPANLCGGVKNKNNSAISMPSAVRKSICKTVATQLIKVIKLGAPKIKVFRYKADVLVNMPIGR